MLRWTQYDNGQILIETATYSYVMDDRSRQVLFCHVAGNGNEKINCLQAVVRVGKTLVGIQMIEQHFRRQ